ncbi:MAG: hypothetical protein COV67_12445 [Nitrospinae bacterium CG11_big_fil_rev_8_21_14_0_20_56_8]|nr:MAG: hypothetical protein COV67_12445 [Nitrospinae bacterium CG11_big_fil_rev_8_21_14_0_20_56_8]
MSSLGFSTNTALPQESLVNSWVEKYLGNVPVRGAYDPEQDQRNDYRLNLASLQALDAAIITREGTIYGITILNLSASGLSCAIPQGYTPESGEPVTISLYLPLKEHIHIYTEMRLVTQTPHPDGKRRVARYRYSEAMDEEDRENIHRFVMEKQFELIRKERAKKGHLVAL